MSEPILIECIHCGAEPHVRLSNMQTTVYLCLPCYDRECETETETERLAGGRTFDAIRVRGQIAGMMVAVGTLIASATSAAEFLHVTNSEGFGWKQMLILLVGMLFMGCGALFRIGVLGAVGGVLAFMAVFADVLALGDSLAVGWAKTISLGIAALLIAVGWLIARGTNLEPPSSDDGPPRLTPLQTDMP